MTIVQNYNGFANRSTATERLAAMALRRATHTATVRAEPSWTYAELHDRAARVTASLQERGIGIGKTVASLVRPGPEAVAAMLGVLRAGACYVPLDPGDTPQMQSFILRDTCPAVVLGDRDLLEHTPTWNGLVLDLDLILQSPDRPVTSCCIPPDSPAFLIYTPGSTGEPESVMVVHRAIVSLVWANTHPPLVADDAVSPPAAMTFEAAFFELWRTLLRGGTLAFPPIAATPSPQKDASGAFH